MTDGMNTDGEMEEKKEGMPAAEGDAMTPAEGAMPMDGDKKDDETPAM